jgi:lycopene beta-cyclase
LKQYDYIITGAGCAGLSLLLRLLEKGALAGRQVLLLDKEPKQHNDRTWCFWERKPGFFEPVVYRKWDSLQFHSNDFSRKLDIAPYQYKMIRGSDFYAYCFSVLQRHSNISIVYGRVESIEAVATGAVVRWDGGAAKASFVFNSIQLHAPGKEHWLLQHFKGWVIDTDKPVFDSGTATLMDFRVAQNAGTGFVYIMPFSEGRALIEYTQFSKTLLSPGAYDKEIRDYIGRLLPLTGYSVVEEETGSIPMTNYLFPPYDGNIIHIGTAGGQTRASSGYTFQFIQKRTEAITNALLLTGRPFTKEGLPSKKSRFYDSVLLNILTRGKPGGDKVFSSLFRRNSAQSIFRFLDDESSLKNDLAVIGSLPVLPFLGAAMREFPVFQGKAYFQ